ncbi:MAG: cytochrome c [Deltaproteobacteria bacterium]|nr:cytochrome c [Deltaproteobacteria bacterium]
MKTKVALIVIGLWLGAGWTPGALAVDAGSGKAVYEKSCVSCHGADGKGNAAMAKVLGEKGLNIVGKDTTKKSDAQLLKVIVDGAGKMPAQKSLSKDEQKQVLGHVRSLAK